MESRLNNFILWCKNWYVPIDNSMDIITQAQKALVLDSYLSVNNPIFIAMSYIDELVNNQSIKPIRMTVWYDDINKYMNFYEWDYNTALMYKIKYFFAFECAKFSLKPPTYSRNTYKLGFRSPKIFGNSYKLANFKVKMFFKNKS